VSPGRGERSFDRADSYAPTGATGHLRGPESQGLEGVKKSIALTTETQRHREKALSFQFSVPLCLCGERFVS